MPSAQDSLYELFLEIAGEQKADLTPLALAGEELAGTLKSVTREIAGAVPKATATSTPAAPSAAAGIPGVISAFTTASSPLGTVASSGGGVVDALEAVGSTVLTTALGTVPLIGGILSLFGGGGDSEAPPPPLLKFALPPALNFTAASTAAGLRQVDFDQQGLPRSFRPDVDESPVARREGGQQVTVNVQALDARSFLDRSTEIAAAVRDAMLHLNSINDVVNDL
jgi:hypothetical protein